MIRSDGHCLPLVPRRLIAAVLAAVLLNAVGWTTVRSGGELAMAVVAAAADAVAAEARADPDAHLSADAGMLVQIGLTRAESLERTRSNGERVGKPAPLPVPAGIVVPVGARAPPPRPTAVPAPVAARRLFSPRIPTGPPAV